MRFMYVLLISLIIISNLSGQEKYSKTLSLKSAIEIGLKNNPLIKIAQENINAEKGRHLSGVTLPQPEINYENQWIPSYSSATGEKTFSVSQSIEFPTVYFLKDDKYCKAELIAEYKRNLLKQSLISQIKKNYYKVLVKQELINLGNENLKISEDFYKKAEIRLNVGEGTNLEKLTAKVQLTESQINIGIIENELKTALAELNYSLGAQNSDSLYILSDTLQFIDYNVDYEELIKVIEDNNYEIKIAKLNSEISEIEKSIAWSGLLPNINLAYFKQSRDGNDFNGYSAGISIPLWFMFDQKGKIEEAKANQAIISSECVSVKNILSLKLQSAINEFDNNLKQVKLYKDEIMPQTNEIFSTAIKSYDAGEITYLEYLNAKQTLVGSQNHYLNMLMNYYQSLFTIEEIIGHNVSQ
jgi:outer membrane protein TolC